MRRFVFMFGLFCCSCFARGESRPVQILLSGDRLVELQNPTRLNSAADLASFDFEKHPFIQNLEKSFGEKRQWRSRSTQDASIGSCVRHSVQRDFAQNQRQIHALESYAVLCTSYPTAEESFRPFQGSYAIFPRERKRKEGTQKTSETIEVVNLMSSPFSNDLKGYFSGQKIENQSVRALSEAEKDLLATQCSPRDGFKAKSCQNFGIYCPDGVVRNGICGFKPRCPEGKVEAIEALDYLREKYQFPQSQPWGVYDSGMISNENVPSELSGLLSDLSSCQQTERQTTSPNQSQNGSQSASGRTSPRFPSRAEISLSGGIQLSEDEYESLISLFEDPPEYGGGYGASESPLCLSCPRGSTFTEGSFCRDRNGCDVLTEELRGGVCRLKDCNGPFAHEFCSDKSNCKEACQKALARVRGEKCMLDKIIQHADKVKATFSSSGRSTLYMYLSANLTSTLFQGGAQWIRENRFESTLGKIASELQGIEASLQLTEKNCVQSRSSCKDVNRQIIAAYEKAKLTLCPPGEFLRESGLPGAAHGCSSVNCSECGDRTAESLAFQLPDFRHPQCSAAEVRTAILSLQSMLNGNAMTMSRQCQENKNPGLCSRIETSFTENDVVLFMKDVQKLPCAQNQTRPASGVTTTTSPTKTRRGLGD